MKYATYYTSTRCRVQAHGSCKKYGIYYVTCLEFFRCKIFASRHRPLDCTTPAIPMENCRGTNFEQIIIMNPWREKVSLWGVLIWRTYKSGIVFRVPSKILSSCSPVTAVVQIIFKTSFDQVPFHGSYQDCRNIPMLGLCNRSSHSKPGLVPNTKLALLAKIAYLTGDGYYRLPFCDTYHDCNRITLLQSCRFCCSCVQDSEYCFLL